ncbi:MAG TPA: YkgJ family cysteine cluster protein [Bryobacteraceae bacterium]|nr:YkgJ family cysteine cluster protein [Bryobacteraceae bacterium]
MQGLRFVCQAECTKCCEVSGYVYLTEQDLKRAAAHLGMSAPSFEKKYIYRTKHLLRLRKPRGSQCHFLEKGGCSIHPVKPLQCRVFPFWPEKIGSPTAWRETGRMCPGIGEGPLIPIDGVMRVANEMREAYMGMYSRPGRVTG